MKPERDINRAIPASESSLPRRREPGDPTHQPRSHGVTPALAHPIDKEPTVTHSKMDPRLRGDDGRGAPPLTTSERRRAVERLRKPRFAGYAALVSLATPALALAQETAAAAAPVANKGDVAWLLVCSALVIFMTLPGLALFYGGLVRSKNVLSELMQCLLVFSLVAVLWALYGYSLAFTPGNAFIGGFDRLFAKGLDATAMGATFTKGVYIPELVFFVFQGAFACITCALIIGAFAERVKFAGVLTRRLAR